MKLKSLFVKKYIRDSALLDTRLKVVYHSNLKIIIAKIYIQIFQIRIIENKIDKPILLQLPGTSKFIKHGMYNYELH